MTQVPEESFRADKDKVLSNDLTNQRLGSTVVASFDEKHLV